MSRRTASSGGGADPGRVVLITGGSSGIGAETARHAWSQGCRLVLAARSADRLSALLDELGAGDRAIAVQCDVREWSDQRAAVQAGFDAFGRLDIVFANAGIGGVPGFEAESPALWREMVLTNVYGAALTIRATVEALRETRGHLVLTGSVAGRIVYPGSLYSCTKWAITAMAEAARAELQGTGVRVTLIGPGVVDTPFFPEREPVALHPEDIARAVMFAIGQPAHVDVSEIVVRPTDQAA